MTKYYKWTADGGPIYGAGEYVLDGSPQPRIEGPLEMSLRGYHVCTREQVPYGCGSELWEVEVDAADVVQTAADKTLVRTWRAVRQLAWTRADMVDYARAGAQRAAAYAAYTARAAITTRADASAADASAADASAADAERQWQLDWIEQRLGETLQ